MNSFFSNQPIKGPQALAVVRVVTGLLLAYHGWEVFDDEVMKSYLQWDKFGGELGKIMVYSGKSAELLAGILLIIGWQTRIASLLVILILSYIAFFVGKGKIWYEDQHPFLFVLLGILFLFLGPGSWSFDGLRSRKKP